MVAFEKSKMVCFDSSGMKYIAVSRGWSTFAVKLICYIVFWSLSSFWCLVKSVAIIL